MELTLKSKKTLEKMTLEEVKVELAKLAERYEKSLDSNLNGDIEIARKIELYTKRKMQLIKQSLSNKNASTKKKKKSVNNNGNNKKNVNNNSINKKNGNDNNKKKFDYERAVIDVVKYDSIDGSFMISYHEFGKQCYERYYLESEDIEKSKLLKTELQEKYGNKNVKKVDVNLWGILNKFDEKHNSSCADTYVNSKIGYSTTYDLMRIFKNKNYSLKDKISLLIAANKQKMYDKADVINPKGLFVAPLMTACILGLTIFGANINKSDKNKVLSEKKSTTEKVVSSSEEIVSEQKVEVSENNDVVKISPSTNTIEKVTEVVLANDEDEKLEDTNLEENKNGDTNIDDSEYKIYDNYVLDSVDLRYDVVEDIAHVNTDKLDDYNYYKISLISVWNGSTLLDNTSVSKLENKTLSEYISEKKNEFGDDISFNINWDAYDSNDKKVCDYVGWCNLEDLNVVKSSDNNEKLEKLEQLKSELLSFNDNESSNKKTNKVMIKK